MINLSIHIPLLGLFLVIGLAILFQIRPRARNIMDELAALAASNLESSEIEMDFRKFMAWHQVVHNIDRRRIRLGATLALASIIVIIGAFSSATAIALNMLDLDLAEPIIKGIDATSGIAVVIGFVGSLDPCFLIYSHHQRITE